MAIKLNDKYVSSYIAAHEYANVQASVSAAAKTLREKSGAGNAFLGWVDLPDNYDKEEFDRIKVAAEKIQKSCDVLVVIGIGGSYLGARAAIEFVKSPLYNNLKKLNVQADIALHYGVAKIGIFQSYFETIRKARNMCAHGNVLFDTRLPQRLPPHR